MKAPWRAVVLGGLIVLAVSACSGPRFVPNPESGLELRWPNGDGNIEQAAQLADGECAESGRRARFAEEFADRDESLARFFCR